MFGKTSRNNLAGTRSPIGIDAGRRHVHAVQLERSRTAPTGWRVAAAVSMPRATAQGAAGAPPVPTSDEVRRLAEILERHGFGSNQVVLAAADGLLTSILELPPMAGGAPVEQITRMELARTHRLAPDAFEMGSWDLPAPARAQKASHVMAVALPHDKADALCDAFEREGLEVRALDVRPWAVARACDALRDAAGGITAVLDLGWGSAELTLIYRNALIFGRSIPDAGIGALHAALMNRLRVEADVAEYAINEVDLRDPNATGDNVADASARAIIAGHFETAAQELTASFTYAAHQYADTSVTRMLLVGGGAGIRGVAEHLERLTGVGTRAASPAALVECAPESIGVCASTALTAALGLAQYPVEEN